jgi:3-hydroxybutyryl-CoA dehydrogenase
MEIRKVGVVGCGSMGSGIAQLAAQSGYEVVVREVNQDLLNKGLAGIKKVLSKGVEKGKMNPEEMDRSLSRIKGTVNPKDFSDCDLVIEAVVENLDLKKEVFAELDKICPKHTLLSSNTSCLSVIDIAMATSRPDRVLGLHFFYPAPLMALLEIVKTIATSDASVESAKEFGKRLGKSLVVAKDTPGYIVNRLFVPYILSAIRMYEAGVATREDIDAGIKLGLNYPMGPLTLADFTGNDVICFVASAMYEQTRDPALIPPTLLTKMVAAGWLGRKTGRGFYEYK